MTGSMFLKWENGDTGARPITPCGPPNVVWENASLSITDPTNGSALAGAKVGQQVNINATVSSESATFPPDVNEGLVVQVQIWVCDFTLAIGPKGGVNSAGGAGGLVGLVRTPLSPESPQTVTVQWTPAAGDLTNIDPSTGNGHLCLGANCFWEGSTPPAEGADLTDPNAVLDICGNQHHGQKNIAILPANSPHMKIKVWNFSRERMTVQLGIEERRTRVPVITGGEAGRVGDVGGHLGEIGQLGEGGRPIIQEILGLGTVNHLLAHPAVTHAGAAVPPPGGLTSLKLPTESTLVLAKDPLAPLHLATSGAPEFSIAGATARGRAIKEVIEPGTPGELNFTATPAAGQRAGALHVFDLTQRAPDGRLLGGARIVTMADSATS